MRGTPRRNNESGTMRFEASLQAEPVTILGELA